jgi:segregation and condensation protein B
VLDGLNQEGDEMLSEEDDLDYGDEEDGEGEIDEETLKKLQEQGYDVQGDDDEDEEFDQYGDEEEGEDDFNEDEDDDDYDDEDDDDDQDVAPAPKRSKK